MLTIDLFALANLFLQARWVTAMSKQHSVGEIISSARI